MMGWQWHQLDNMQIICTLLQTDNHASTSQNQDGRQLMPVHVRSQYVQNNSAEDRTSAVRIPVGCILALPGKYD